MTTLLVVVSIEMMLAVGGCASGSAKSGTTGTNNSTPVAVTVSPHSVPLQVSKQQQFTVNVTGTSNTAVSWTASGGAVTSTGMYTAPSTAGTFTVTATSQADNTKSDAATVTVSVAAPPPTPTPTPTTGISIAPSSVLVAPGGQQQFTSNVAANWSASGGTISASGLYTAPATTGTFTVTATNKANASQSASATVNVSSPPPPGSANAWANRIAGVNIPGGAASVVGAQSFDTFPPTNKQQYFQIYDAPSITTDCTVAADGCSLKFAVLQGYVQGEPGWFDWNFTPDLSRTFGEGQEFFVQFRERLDPGMLNGANFPNSEGFKSSIVTVGDSPTAQSNDCSTNPGHLVMQQENGGAPYPVLYHNCGFSGGAFHFMQSPYETIQLSGVTNGSNTNFLDQNAAGCPHYSGRGTPTTDPTCWNYTANEWFTVQIHVKIGTFNQPTSVLDMWLAHEGKPAQLAVNASDAALLHDGTVNGSGKYGKISLLPYQTAMTGSLANTGVWYDDLMVATRRIPDPNVSTPNAPDSLSLSSITAGGVTLNWRVNSQNGTAQDDTGFLIERCTGAGAACFPNPQSGFAQIGTTAAGATSFVDTTVVSGTTYTYRVRAKNAAGNSGYTIAQCFNGGTTCGGTVKVP
ncbi:MAG TPA: hypothetical protein VF532_16865 [Candidatus Angelobacter sp.]